MALLELEVQVLLVEVLVLVEVVTVFEVHGSEILMVMRMMKKKMMMMEILLQENWQTLH